MGGKGYMYGLVGRTVMIKKEPFHGYNSYPTREAAEKEAKNARLLGHKCRIVPQGTRFVLMTSIKRGK